MSALAVSELALHVTHGGNSEFIFDKAMLIITKVKSDLAGYSFYNEYFHDLG